MEQTALQRIKDIEEMIISKGDRYITQEGIEFLLKAFNVMRKIAAIGHDEYATLEEIEKIRDAEFENQMSK